MQYAKGNTPQQIFQAYLFLDEFNNKIKIGKIGNEVAKLIKKIEKNTDIKFYNNNIFMDIDDNDQISELSNVIIQDLMNKLEQHPE